MHASLKILFISSIFVYSLCDNKLIVVTNNGELRGNYMYIESGKTIKAYLGIPYAEPPIGELRFKDPIPIENWKGIKNATKVHPICAQADMFSGTVKMSGVEDCLFLNIYTPKDIPEKLPVMVFIHGGAFSAGAGSTTWYRPDILLAKENVILVTMNYRLGPLGFATTDDELVHGNMGLKDQALSMKWVKENIENFGGDPNKITIFGESAGATSVHLLMMSPISKGLYHAAISQSGTALINLAIHSTKQGAVYTRKLAELLECPTESTRNMINCLRKKNVNDIMEKQKMLLEWGVDPIVIFRPVVEHKHAGAFIYKHPREIIKAGGVHNVPWMNGVNADEGLLRMPSLLLPNALEEFDNDFERIAKLSMFVDMEIPNSKNVIKKIKDFYLDGKTLKESEHKNIVDMYSDAWFIAGSDEAVNMMRNYSKQPIYYYLFGYKGGVSIMNLDYGLELEGDFGPGHGEELQYLVPAEYQVGINKSETDIKISDILTTLWTNFATYKNPTPNSVEGEVEWKPVQSDDVEYLYISDDLEMKTDMFEKRVKFWRNLKNHIMNDIDES